VFFRGKIVPMATSKGPRAATAADVARAAGVSRTTVSHILNGYDVSRFPEQTKLRVRGAAEALHYRPSPAGRGLVTGRSDTIVVVIPSTTIASSVQDVMERIAQKLHPDANVVLRIADSDPELTVRAVLKLRPLAVVDFGAIPLLQRRILAEQGISCVPGSDERPSHPEANPAFDAIARIQVGELLKRGPRQVVFAALDDRRTDPYGPGRLAAIERACKHVSAGPPLRIRVAPEVSSALAALDSLDLSKPVGIAAYNDTVGLALLAAARVKSIPVPGHLSVIGMDGTDAARLWSPPLTSVGLNLEVFADQAIAELTPDLPGRWRTPDLLESGPIPSMEEALTLTTGGTT
jgi:DNA-binding LacI/PurR family transcriptional regulator